MQERHRSIDHARLQGTLAAVLVACAANATAQADSPAAADTPSRVHILGSAPDQAYAPDSAAVGGKQPLRLTEIAQSVTVFSQQRMLDQNLFTLGDLMQQAPGVTVMPFDGINPDFRARGYSLEIAYDGIPTNSSGSGTQEYDLSLYDRVEVLRGPNGVTQGSGQPGGVVNFVRKRGTRQFHWAGGASAGSWNNRRLEADVGGPLNAAGTVRGRAVATWQARDFFYDVGHDRKWLGYATVDADLTPRTTLSLAFTRQDDRVRSPSMGLPAFLDGGFLDVDRSTHVNPAWNRFAWTTTQAEAELAQRLDGGWEVRAKVLRREVDKFYKDAYPSTGVNRRTMTATYARRMAGLDFERKSADLYASGPLALFGRRHLLTLGYNYDARLSENRNITYAAVPNVPIFDPRAVTEPQDDFNRGSDSRVSQAGLYGQARLSVLDPLTVVLGARASRYRSESRTTAPAPATAFVTGARETGEVTPSAAAVWQLGVEASAYAGYSDIFLPQTVFDAEGRVLQPRVGRQLELGTKGRFLEGRLFASAAAFSIRDRNRALATNIPEVYTPAGDVKVEGAEFEIGGRPMRALELTASYTWLSTKYGTHPTLAGTEFSTYEPRHTGKLYARWQPAWLRGGFLGGGLTGNSRVLGGGVAGLREQGGYAVASAQAGYALSPGLTLTLSANNLFDRVYRARVGGLNAYNIYGEPRNLLLTLRGSY
jgi:outer membrane receptor for ferric coprogen and ferric-rhodotorulic acid